MAHVQIGLCRLLFCCVSKLLCCSISLFYIVLAKNTSDRRMAHPLELLDSLLMKMKEPESLLTIILPFTPPEMPAELLSKLKVKLKHIDSVLSNPEISEDQLEEWWLRLIALWTKYCSLCKDIKKKQQELNQQTVELSSKTLSLQIKEPEPAKQKQQTKELFLKEQSLQFHEPDPFNPKQQTLELTSKMQSLHVPALVPARPDETILKAVIPSSFPIYKYKPRNQTIFHEDENYPKTNYDKVLSKNGLKVKMQNAFYDLEIDDENDLDGLAAMLRILSLASKLAEPYARDYGLKYDLFEYAKSKLPVKMKMKVKAVIGNARSIKKLFDMLQKYIIDAVENRRKALDSQFDDKQIEVCLKCFRLGHNKSVCPNEMLPRVILG